ncbi:MAG TPA: GNAT family N-acetyltransferase [Pirellulales bacterium]|nr:GNAT family N-acetyltransferase [Pirellulales bacterium]
MTTGLSKSVRAARTMADVAVTPVTSWRERRQFVQFPFDLYRDDPNWMPPLLGNQKELLGYKRHPFYDHADCQTFLARRNGRVCGRIAAIINRAHNDFNKERRGFFGFFESTDDPAVARSLFAAAAGWLKQHGMESLRGPANPSMNYECGLLIEGFDSPPTFMMTYNPPYYPQLVESYGFTKGHDLLAYLGERGDLPSVRARLDPLADQAQARCNAVIRHTTRRTFKADVEAFVDLYNRTLTVNWGFVPLPPGEMRKLAASLEHLIVPELAVIAEVEGVPVGAIIGLPDYNPRIKEIGGRLFPFGVFRLLSKKKDISRVRILSINVVPEYQRWGLGLVLMKALSPKGIELGFDEAEFSWISEDNDMARLGLEKGGAKVYKKYRMYDLNAL